MRPRLGDDHSVRLPTIGSAPRQGEKEAAWLPVLAPHLPVEVPVAHEVGEPGEGSRPDQPPRPVARSWRAVRAALDDRQ